LGDFVLFLVNTITTVLWLALLGRVILSWLNVTPQSPLYPIATILWQVTEPILSPIRRMLPSMGMFDLSPMIALLLVTLIQRVVRAVVG
jgi:YggT family protein